MPRRIATVGIVCLLAALLGMSMVPVAVATITVPDQAAAQPGEGLMIDNFIEGWTKLFG